MLDLLNDLRLPLRAGNMSYVQFHIWLLSGVFSGLAQAVQ